MISRSGLVLRIFLILRQTSKYKKADERQVWCIVSVKEAGGCTDIIAEIRNHHILRYIKIDSIYTQLYLSPTMQFSFWCTVMFTVASFMSDSMLFFLKTNFPHYEFKQDLPIEICKSETRIIYMNQSKILFENIWWTITFSME